MGMVLAQIQFGRLPGLRDRTLSPANLAFCLKKALVLSENGI